MRYLAMYCAVLSIAACAKPDNQAGGAPTLSLAQVAGMWQVKGFNPAGDSIVAYQFTATGSTVGWSTLLPGRPLIPVTVVAVAGDSVTIASGPFESVLRPGVQVNTTGVLRLQGDKLVGTTTARYTTTGADSVLVIRIEGTRVP